MTILDKLLRHRGIKDVTELDKEEKDQFVVWQAVLSKGELTIEDIKKFCQAQITLIEAKWSNLEISQEKKAEFIPYHTVYKLLLGAIDSPKQAREALEAQLNQLIK